MALGQSVYLIGQGVGPSQVNSFTFTMREKPAIVVCTVQPGTALTARILVDGAQVASVNLSGSISGFFSFILGAGINLACCSGETAGQPSAAAPLSIPIIAAGRQVTVELGATASSATQINVAIST